MDLDAFKRIELKVLMIKLYVTVLYFDILVPIIGINHIMILIQVVNDTH